MSSNSNFTQFLMYRLLNAPDWSKLNELPAEQMAREPSSSQFATIGFHKVVGQEHDGYLKVSADYRLITVRKHERLIAPKAVRQAVDKKVRQIEKEQERKVYGRERNEIKQEIVNQMIPRAQVTYRDFRALAWDDLILVETSSHKRAEEVLSMLREGLGSLAVRPVTTKFPPKITMTEWVRDWGTRSEPSLGEFFQSSSADESGEKLSGSKVDLLAAGELNELLTSGARQISALEIGLKSELLESYVWLRIDEKLSVSRVQWPDELTSRIMDELGEEDDPAAGYRATMMIVGAACRELVGELLQALGGELLPENLSDDADDDEELI